MAEFGFSHVHILFNSVAALLEIKIFADISQLWVDFWWRENKKFKRVHNSRTVVEWNPKTDVGIQLEWFFD